LLYFEPSLDGPTSSVQYRFSPWVAGPSFRAFAGRLKSMVRRHRFMKDSLAPLRWLGGGVEVKILSSGGRGCRQTSRTVTPSNATRGLLSRLPLPLHFLFTLSLHSLHSLYTPSIHSLYILLTLSLHSLYTLHAHSQRHR